MKLIKLRLARKHLIWIASSTCFDFESSYVRSLHRLQTKLPSHVSRMKQQKTNGQQSLSCSTVPTESSLRLTKWILYNGILVHPFTQTLTGTSFGISF
ncbi:hypothetical protein Csa_003228 [Cucumis sativus]|uniref:Uncharacterized protein n=1 Tax=Cucumis sativus TaxID=3659 RepID=A0A0A0KG61_CUCSA|nr:hypothetical protein Csa_003228 [Cucumis sativus]